MLAAFATVVPPVLIPLVVVVVDADWVALMATSSKMRQVHNKCELYINKGNPLHRRPLDKLDRWYQL